MKKILLALSFAIASISLHAAESEEGFVKIFDGESFAGWKMATEHTNTWRIQDGAFVARGDRNHLFFEGDRRPYTNFELRVEVMTHSNSNGGIYFHTKYQPTGWPTNGFETQVNNSHSDWKKTGSLYDVVNVRIGTNSPAQTGPAKLVTLQQPAATDDKWWTQDITAKDKNVVIKIDGKVVVDYTEPADQEPGKDFVRKLGSGTFALQAHDPNSVVWYKNIRVKRLD